ncbi:MAG: carboxypeptidase-like regulatory domain-containing protein, partial [Candidatus Acidiferrum sp.]
GNVQGKVVQEPGGQGIRKVIVQLKSASGDAQQDYTTATDAAGQFKIEGVAPGEYGVSITRLGYVEMSKKTEEATITVQAGQDVTGLVYKMQATGVITGKIVDADGDPVPSVAVGAQRIGKAAAGVNGGPINGDAGQAVTNDLGEFRIANLPPGQYLVRAQGEASAGPAPNPADKGHQREGAVYALTYYPGTYDEKQATPVHVTSGGTALANFNMVTSRSFRVSGTVVAPGNGRIMQIILTSKNGQQVEQQNVQEGGQFNFPNMLPGTYVARVIEVNITAGEQAPQMRMYVISTPIVVSTTDVTGLQLQTETGGAVSGKFRTEGEEPIAWAEMIVALRPEVESGEDVGPMEMAFMNGNVATLKRDGTFEIKNVAAGDYQLEIGARSEKFRDYYTKSVTLGGRDVTDTGFSVSGETALEVVVSAKGASIEGMVVDGKGEPVAQATVVTVPSSGKLGRPDSYQTDKTDEKGHFLLRGMNPGGFVVLAMENAAEDVRKPEFLQKYGAQGEKVELQEGDRKSVKLVMVSE